MRLNKVCTGSYKMEVTTTPCSTKGWGRVARKLPVEKDLGVLVDSG